MSLSVCSSSRSSTIGTKMFAEKSSSQFDSDMLMLTLKLLKLLRLLPLVFYLEVFLISVFFTIAIFQNFQSFSFVMVWAFGQNWRRFVSSIGTYVPTNIFWNGSHAIS